MNAPCVMSPDGRKKLPLEKAPLTIECVDIWMPGQLTPVKRAAYDRLAALGTIRLVEITCDPCGRTIARYLAAVPRQWARASLGEIAREDEQVKFFSKG